MATLIKTNSKVYRERIYKEILDAINFEHDGEYIEDLTPKQKIDYLFSSFEREFNYENNKKRYPNYQERLAQWLMGQPSYIHLPSYNFEILEFAARVHGIDEVPENKQDIIINGFYMHMAYMIMKLKETLNK